MGEALLLRMKSKLLGFLLAAPIGAAAQTLQAEDLERLCTSGDKADRLSCNLIVKVYLDGFIEGVAKGALDTYKFDPQVRTSVERVQMKDMAPRVSKVIESSTCIQRVSVSEMAGAFVEHVQANPSLRKEHYRKAMTRTIASKFCAK
ncbi:hypothetical protein [Roseateles microcysteis]|uniref:hypothetical protein n=1 Tax=Roseateles microcysteis TaxID=3119057 RepID=UPI002FE61D3B